MDLTILKSIVEYKDSSLETHCAKTIQDEVVSNSIEMANSFSAGLLKSK